MVIASVIVFVVPAGSQLLPDFLGFCQPSIAAQHCIATDQQSMSETEREASNDKTKSTRLPAALCWAALALFAASLVLPALRVQGKGNGQGRGEWIAGDLGFHCAFLSLAEFPCWVPHALVIAAPFIAVVASKPAQRACGLVLGITTLTVLHECIPRVALTSFRQGLLPGFWLWAAALITATAGLLLVGFSPVGTSSPGRSSGEVSMSPRSRLSLVVSRTPPNGALLLCWLGFAVFVLTNLVSLGLFIYGSFSRGLSRSISVFMLDQVVTPALLAMAPLACIYAGARTQRFMALALGLAGLLPFLSLSRPAEQPFEALAPLLVSYLPVALAVAGLLVSSGSINRSRNRDRKARAGLAAFESSTVPLANRQSESVAPLVSQSFARGNPPLGSALCWLALAHSLGLGSLAFGFEWINQLPSALALVWVISSHPTLTCSLLAMAPWVCTFSGPGPRRILGAFLGLGALMMLPGARWLGLRALPELIAFSLSAAGLFWADIAARHRGE
jgi:hypothetical protein